jgi:hypothetical protein
MPADSLVFIWRAVLHSRLTTNSLFDLSCQFNNGSEKEKLEFPQNRGRSAKR